MQYSPFRIKLNFTIIILMKMLSILGFFALIGTLYCNYISELLLRIFVGQHKAFFDTWIKGLPLIIFWIALIYCGWKKYRLILYGFLFIAYFYSWSNAYNYISQYHTYMGNAYLPGQIMALIFTVAIPLGLLTLVLHCIEYFMVVYENK